MNLLEGRLPKAYYEKNLWHLNRSLDKLIVIDTDDRIYRNFPDNGLVMPKRMREMGSTATLELIEFLYLLTNELRTPDVRLVIRHYAQFGDLWLDEFNRDRSFMLEEAERQNAKAEVRQPPPARE